MAIQTIKAGSRYFKVTTNAVNQAGFPFIEIGPAGTTTSVSTFVVQFNPDNLWNGQFVVVGRTMGSAADNANTPFEPIPYRRVSLNNAASDYALVADPIQGAAIIQIPANGMSVALLAAVAGGQNELTMWDLQGSSAI